MHARSRKPGIKALYSVAEVAEMLGFSPRGARSWIVREGIRTIRMGTNIMIPFDAIAEKCPEVHSAMVAAIAARRAAS